MYELLFAVKYLIPKRRSLSTTLISILSIVIITLVVWLVLVFLSVTSGMEKGWIDKLTSFNAPLRITPTEKYYNSYYYQIDKFSAESNYSLKNFKEKIGRLTNPHDPQVDVPLPSYFPSIDRHANQSPVDPVNELTALLQQLPVRYDPYEISAALLRLNITSEKKRSVLSQMSYLMSICPNNPNYHKLLLEENNATFPRRAYLENQILKLPEDTQQTPVLLPKSLKKAGAALGNEGHLQFLAQTLTSSYEHSVPIYVAGFYDPGVFPVGSRALIIPYEMTALINASASTSSPDGTPTSGFYVWPNKISAVKKLKKQIQLLLKQQGIAPFWSVTTFHEYEFAKDLLEQFQSDRTLLTLIATIILIVACSNIISLLILLVNDKKKEIAVLQAMGASKKNIALIFGLCGITMGLISTIMGTVAAIFTLHHIDRLASFISALQGHDLFNTSFFGTQLPNQLSLHALLFIFIGTPLIALIAGIIPAWRAGKISPSSTLRSQ